MASTAAGRGAQTMNSMYFKPILRKAYHRKSGSPDVKGDGVKLNVEEGKQKTATTAGSSDCTWWIRDDRTGIYYPKGQEKVIENVSPGTGKEFGIVNWFD